MDLSAFGSPEDFAWGLANDPNFLKTAASYGISYADILNYIAPTVAPAPEPTPAPTPAPTPEPTPAPTPEPTPSPTPAPTSAPEPVYVPTYEPPPTYTEPEPVYYEPPPRTPYNGYDFNSIVSQTQTRANQGFTPSELYNYAVYSLGFTGPEAQSILASVSFPKTAEQIEAERLAAEREAQRVEAERLAAEQAARDVARLEAERLAAQEAARLEAIRVENERIAEAQRVEAARLAAEEAARLEAQRIESERIAAEEAARIAAEEAAKLVVTPAPTPAPTPEPTAAPTPEPTIAPTAAPAPAPTEAPTPAPTIAPTPAPTLPPASPTMLDVNSAISAFYQTFGRPPTDRELTNFENYQLNSTMPFRTLDEFNEYLRASIATPTPTPTPTTTPTPTPAPTAPPSAFASIDIDTASSVFEGIFGRQPYASELTNFFVAIENKDPRVASVEAFTQYLMGTMATPAPTPAPTATPSPTPTPTVTPAPTGTPAPTVTPAPTPSPTTTPTPTVTPAPTPAPTVTPAPTLPPATPKPPATVLSELQARSIFLNLFGRQPSTTELANFLAAQSSTNPFVTPQSLESYLRGTDAYTKYLQGLQQPTTSGFSSVPQTFGGAFSVPVTPMAGPAYYEVGGSPIMESSAVAGPEIRRRTQQRLGEGFTREQLTNYAISQGLSPDVIKYAFGENVTLPGTIQTGLTPAFRSGAAGFTSMRPSSLEFGVPAVSQAVQQYTPNAFDKAALQAAYEQATGQTYGGENVDQMQQTGSWNGGKVTKDKIAYEKGGKVRGLLGPNPDNPDDGYGSLQVGEYVIRKKAVNKYGEDFLEALNESRLPKKKAKSLL